MNTASADRGKPCQCLVVAVTGSVGAAQVPEQLQYLQTHFAETLHVIMTAAARQFVSPTVLRLISGQPVLVDLFDDANPFPVPHMQLQEHGQLLLVLPATANILAKAAHGICDDLVTTTILTFGERVVFVPNMNEVMWHNAIVQENVEKLVSLGRSVIAPTSAGIEVYSKRLGVAGMPTIAVIAEYLEELLHELSVPEPVAAAAAPDSPER